MLFEKLSALFRNALRHIGLQQFTIDDLRRAGIPPEKVKAFIARTKFAQTK